MRFAGVLEAALVLAAFQGTGAPGSPCPDPARPCPGFRPHDLSFVLPRDGAARAESAAAPSTR